MLTLKPASVAKITSHPSGTCGHCGAAPVRPAKLKKCAQCFSLAYCGTECSTAHWQRHKAACKTRMGASVRINHRTLKEHMGGAHCTSVSFAMMDAKYHKPEQSTRIDTECKRSFVVRVQIPVDLSFKSTPLLRASASLANCLQGKIPALYHI
mmetsp:Transcript_5746/g.8881  ORF Transcript_5746/g.8881 Transcript_5746/m.8881 type:complete len:153 (+) Transcript_5746:162-620(+)